METVTWSFTDSKIDKQFSKGEKEIPIFNPISSDLRCFKKINIFKSGNSFKKKSR